MRLHDGRVGIVRRLAVAGPGKDHLAVGDRMHGFGRTVPHLGRNQVHAAMPTKLVTDRKGAGAGPFTQQWLPGRNAIIVVDNGSSREKRGAD